MGYNCKLKKTSILTSSLRSIPLQTYSNLNQKSSFVCWCGASPIIVSFNKASITYNFERDVMCVQYAHGGPTNHLHIFYIYRFRVFVQGLFFKRFQWLEYDLPVNCFRDYKPSSIWLITGDVLLEKSFRFHNFHLRIQEQRTMYDILQWIKLCNIAWSVVIQIVNF